MKTTFHMKNYPIRCFIPLLMIYMSIMIFSDLLVKKPVIMPFGYTTAATFIFPLWFLMNDILAEIYGLKLSRKILFTGFIVQLIFDLFSYLLIHMPSPAFWHMQSAFEYIIQPLYQIDLVTLVSFIVGGYLNIFLITKWKILLFGKYFWLRAIGSSIIGELFYSVINVWFLSFSILPTFHVMNVIYWSFILKVIYIILLSLPAAVIVNYIKKIDNIHDNLTFDFNPFETAQST